MPESLAETHSGGSPGLERRALAAGTTVQEFEILRLIGGGGFGLVYLARDTSLGRRVALKEYMPPLAARTPGGAQVTVHFLQDVEAFKAGLGRFLNEARLLARFDHPALVKVHRVWEENGTAYIAMPYYEGLTLQKAVAEKSVPANEDALRQILSPLLDALAALHREQCYHRDISPDNILITATGPVLLDFGAAREMVGSGAQNFTVVLKQGYAPLEQYATEGALSMRQGPWTDIYALSAVMRYAVTGSKPASAVARAARRPDPLPQLSKVARGRYSDAFLRALDAGMALYVEDRPQTIAEFRSRLGGTEAWTVTSASVVAAVQPVPAQLAALRQSVSVAMAGPWPRWLAVAIAPVILLVAAVAIAVHLSRVDTHKAWSSPALLDTDADALNAVAPAVPPRSAEPPAAPSPPREPPAVTKTPKPLPRVARLTPPVRELPAPPPPPAVPVAVVDAAAIKTVSPPQPQPSNAGVQSEGDANRLGDSAESSGPGFSGPVRDLQQSPLEQQFTATVDRVIKAHSMIPDSPEFEAALMKSRGRETVVSFELDRQGKVSQVTVDRPSGSGLLDKTAMRIVSQTQYPPFPAEAWQGKSSHVFSVPLKFQK